MNVKKETSSKIDFFEDELQTFREIYKERFKTFTADERTYFSSKIKNIQKNLEYYNEVLKIIKKGER